MKEKELRAAAVCGICAKPFGHAGAPLFYRVTVEQHLVDLENVKKQTGLAMMLNSPALAQVMGPDADMTTVVGRKVATVCVNCMTGGATVAQVVESST